MIDTDRYDNEGIELTDGGTICFPEDDGRIQRIDKDGNIMQTLHPEDTEWQEWYELFDTHKDLLAEVKRLREELDGREAYIKRLSEQLARMTKWSYKQVLHNDSAMMDFDDYVWGEKND